MGVNLDNEKLENKTEQCSCINPNGFKFLEAGDDYQVWLHVACGGIVKRPMIKRY